MKSNKELVYTFVQERVGKLAVGEGVTTSEVAQKLALQRSNASTLLNQLVDEGFLIKGKGRPVLYSLATEGLFEHGESSCFANLLGHNRSLKNAVQLAKASILYPQEYLNAVVMGEQGVGTSYFVHLMHLFAVENEVISEQQPLIKFNCKHFADEPEQLLQEMFGPTTDTFANVFVKSQRGALFLDHIEFLPAKGRTLLGQILETGQYEVLGTQTVSTVHQPVVLGCDSAKMTPSLESIVTKTPVRIDLPVLAKRSLAERLDLINYFFGLESLRVKKRLTINSELLICLLLYETEKNVRQLQDDIHLGCANAYVGVHQKEQTEIKVFVSHFRPHVRKGFLRYREYREELKQVLPAEYNYSYQGHDIERNLVTATVLERPDLYAYIDKKSYELAHEGVAEQEIEAYLGTELQAYFTQYTQEIKQQEFDTVQLEKVVSKELIELVKQFLHEAEKQLHCTYDPAIFYGLCLHINGIALREAPSSVLQSEQIKEIIEQHKSEYALALQLAAKLESQLGIAVPTAEVALLTLFIPQQPPILEPILKPTILLCMHGEGTARSIVNVVKELSHSTNVFAFDMGLQQKVDDAYQELKQLVREMPTNNGVLLIYDMGSFKTMGEMLVADLQIDLRVVNVPITLFALELARKTMVHDDLDLLYNQSVRELQQLITTENQEQQLIVKPKGIITLCSTGEGGAVQLKNYLEQSPVGKRYRIINCANGAKATIQEIQQELDVVALIGTTDPKVKGIPFLSIATIFATEPAQLIPLIEGATTQTMRNVDFEAVYQYLDEELAYVDMTKLRTVLPTVLLELDQLEPHRLSEEQLLGLFVHIACTLERLLANDPSPQCFSKEMILVKYPVFFQQVLKIMKRLERKFEVIFNDDELATIITIIKQL